MDEFLLSYVALDWLSYKTLLTSSYKALLSCKALSKLSYITELHGSLVIWPSGLSGSLRTELYDPSGTEL